MNITEDKRPLAELTRFELIRFHQALYDSCVEYPECFAEMDKVQEELWNRDQKTRFS